MIWKTYRAEIRIGNAYRPTAANPLGTTVMSLLVVEYDSGASLPSEPILLSS